MARARLSIDARVERLSARERRDLLRVLERFRKTRPGRFAADVDAELAAVRSARHGGRRNDKHQ